jgi:hypothetical protein
LDHDGQTDHRPRRVERIGPFNRVLDGQQLPARWVEPPIDLHPFDREPEQDGGPADRVVPAIVQTAQAMALFIRDWCGLTGSA